MKRNKFGLSSKEYEKLYSVWGNMLKRCYNEECDRFYAYGARGIKVCDAVSYTHLRMVIYMWMI